MSRPRDDEIWAAMDRRLARVESLIPPTPLFRLDLPAPSSPAGPSGGHALAPHPTRRFPTWQVALLLVAVGVVATLLVSLLIAGGRPAPNSKARNGLVAYQVDSDFGSYAAAEIHLVHPDGSADQQLSTGNVVSTCPLFSRDGRQMALWTGPLGAARLRIVPTAGSESASQTIAGTQSPDSGLSAWSPDGSRIAFIQLLLDPSGKSAVGVELRVVTLADGKSQILMPAQRSLQPPAWSPDGQTLALVVGADEKARIDLVSADGARLREIPAPGATGVEWAPDGRRLLYAGYPAGVARSDPLYGFTSIFVVGTDGNGATSLTAPDGANYTYPAWAPDGSRIAYWRVIPGSVAGQLVSMNADGSDPTVLIFGLRSLGNASWSPDGSQLVLSADPPGGQITPSGSRGLVTVSTDGIGRLVVLAQPGAVDNSCPPSWQRVVP